MSGWCRSFAADHAVLLYSAKSGATNCQALNDQNDPLTRYLAPNDDLAIVRQLVASHGEHLIGEASSADLLFQNDDFAAAILCHRTPEQMIQNSMLCLLWHNADMCARRTQIHTRSHCHSMQTIPAAEEELDEAEAQLYKMQMLGKLFGNAQREFLQVRCVALVCSKRLKLVSYCAKHRTHCMEFACSASTSSHTQCGVTAATLML